MIRFDSEQVEQVQRENMVDDILGTSDGHIQVAGLDAVDRYCCWCRSYDSC